MIAEMTMTPANITGLCVLQWGRDQMIAEISRILLIGPPGIAKLQWGRDQMIAEIAGPLGEVGLSDLLQWGRDQMIAEMIVIAGVRPLAGGGFNGAAIK